jgi:hypothetical protein
LTLNSCIAVISSYAINPKAVFADLPIALEIEVQTINPAPLAKLEAKIGANKPANSANQNGSPPSELVATTEVNPTIMLKQSRANPTEKKPVSQAKIPLDP